MVRVNLKGIAKVTTKGLTYYYAWRGGPRLRGEPGTPEFIASYNEAIEARRTPEAGRFKSLVLLYRASPDYAKLADSTRKNWSPWLDRIASYFGELRIAQFDRPEKIPTCYPPMAQSMGRQTADRGLWDASFVPCTLARD